MLVLARFAGPNGVISVVEDLATGARLYREGGVVQSRVLAGGEAGVDYIILMAQQALGGKNLLQEQRDALNAAVESFEH